MMQFRLFFFREEKRTQPDIENKSPEMKKTAFRRRLQRPRVNKTIASINRPDAAAKQAILGADRSVYQIKRIDLFLKNTQREQSYMQQL